jgi:hypothetical protein
MKKTIATIVLLLFAGCAPARPWVRAEKLYANPSQGFSVELPDNWMRAGRVEYLIATRDGFPLQSIFIRRFDINKEPLKNTKKALQKDMLPQEVAEVVLDDTISASSFSDVKMEENMPMMLSGVPGFKLVFTFKNGSGLNMKSIICGCLKDESLLVVRYSAPVRHYFDSDLGTFEKVLRSFKTEK